MYAYCQSIRSKIWSETMQASIIPATYEQWQRCVTVECGIELNEEFITARILALQNTKDHYTQQFVKTYGQQHYQQTLQWFLQANDALSK